MKELNTVGRDMTDMNEKKTMNGVNMKEKVMTTDTRKKRPASLHWGLLAACLIVLGFPACDTGTGGSPSGNADLASLSVSAGTLSPSFSPEVTDYTVNVPNSTASLTVTASSADGGARVSGTGQDLALNVGANEIMVSVVAANGSAKVYTIAVNRASSSASANADLSALSVSYDGQVSSLPVSGSKYTCFVDYATGKATVSAVAADSGATVSGTGEYSLTLGLNAVTVKVVAADGATEKTYEVDIYRPEQKDQSNANLSALSVSTGILSPSFDPMTHAYVVNVPNATASVSVSATAADPLATVSGTGSKALAVGANPFTVTVTSADGSNENSYAITVNRAGTTASSDANLSSLSLIGCTLSPAFSASTTAYTSSVLYTTASVTVSATASDAGATVSGTGKMDLAVGLNTFAVTVTAADGTTKAYTIAVTRAARVLSANADLASLGVSGFSIAPAFSASTTAYALGVENGTSSVSLTATTADSAATVAGTGVKTLVVGDNKLEVTVTAENGTSVKTYTVTVTRAAAPTPQDGAVDISVTPVAGPLAVSFSGNLSTIAEGATMTVSATASEIPDSYAWYLNGVQQSSSTSSITLGSGLAAGRYRVDLLIAKDGRLGSGTFVFDVTSGTVETVATPTFSPAAGAVAENTVVTFASTTSGATFYYTTDGSTPTTSSTSGTSYTITAAVTLKVLAVKSGINDSSVATASYTIASGSSITVNIPATYGEAKTIHYWSVTPATIADSVWASRPALVATETGWVGYTVSGASAMKFLFASVDGSAKTTDQTVSAAGTYYVYYSGGWKISTTKPTL